MHGKITKEILSSLSDEYTNISLIKDDNCVNVSFCLFRETFVFVDVISSILKSKSESDKFLLRNQAICVGILVRISKLMKSVFSMVADRANGHGEAILIINRCIVESVINLKFFCEKASESDFDIFVESGLVSDKDLFDNICENISKRGYRTPIEERMLKSIKSLFKVSKIDIERIDKRLKWKNYRKILEELDLSNTYVVFQKIPSHSIHGTWSDLSMHHLKSKEGGFVPNFKSIIPDSRLLCPVNEIVLSSVKSYIEKYLFDMVDIKLVIDKIDDLINRNSTVNCFHESSLTR